MKTLLTLIIVLAVAAGCKGKPGSLASIQPGKTTKQEIFSMLGSASGQRFETSGETWTYQFIKSGASEPLNVPQSVMEVVVVFKGETVESCTTSISKKNPPTQTGR